MNGEQVVHAILERIKSFEENNRKDHELLLGEIRDLSARVRILEEFKARIYTIAAVVAFTISIITTALLR